MLAMTEPSPWPYDFTPDEWETCLQVLQKVARAPNDVPDLQRMKTLVTKVYKKAKKIRQQDFRQQARTEDRLKIESTQRIQDAECLKAKAFAAVTFQPERQPVSTHRSYRCYVCHQLSASLHPHYHRMCFSCGEISYQHRFAELDLQGRIAIVTGGRIKVGQATVLRLLRAGAYVIATTRFPVNAAAAYAALPDYASFKDRLEIVGLDFLQLGALEHWIEALKARLGHLDILVNNAAQTLWRPPAYYQPLLAAEVALLPQVDTSAISSYLLTDPQEAGTLSAESVTQALGKEEPQWATPYWEQEPTDPRPVNSWILELEAIPAREMLEVQVINSVAPAMLCAQLKPLFEQSPFKTRHIVNVTSSEGQFSYALKQTTHAHTNMSKASLNMLTRTAAAHYAESSIYMNSVDVGWISAETPEPDNLRKEAEGFVPPLDALDGASRIVHPLGLGMAGAPLSGKLLKDYQVVAW
jgi:NAD(P)-dependent dehydrogenase (short-subunit alcohol dehydrogenase family)